MVSFFKDTLRHTAAQLGRSGSPWARAWSCRSVWLAGGGVSVIHLLPVCSKFTLQHMLCNERQSLKHFSCPGNTMSFPSRRSGGTLPEKGCLLLLAAARWEVARACGWGPRHVPSQGLSHLAALVWSSVTLLWHRAAGLWLPVPPRHFFSGSSQRHGPPSRDPMCFTPAVLIPPSPLHTRMPGHAGCHQQAATRAPTSCVPMQLAGCWLRLSWAGPVLQGVPPAAQQLQTSSGLGKPGGCSAVQWAATTPSSRSVDPRPGVAAPLPSVLPQPQVPWSFLQLLFTKV